MPTVDMKIKVGGFWYDPVIYKNIENLTVERIDFGNYKFTFYKVDKKGNKYYHEFHIPEFKLIAYHIRRKE